MKSQSIRLPLHLPHALLSTLAICGVLAFGAAPATTDTTSDPFDRVREWLYRGEPLPDLDSDAARQMRAYYDEHSTKPDVMYWAAVAQSRGLISTSRTPMELTITAAESGHPGAMTRLGIAYLEGDHVAKDRQRGLALLERAVDRGEPTAMAELGRAYIFGLGGLEPDLEKAEGYLRQALDKGYIRAHRRMAQLLLKRGQVDKARGELVAGAEAGDEDAMTAYAVALQKGEFGVRPNPKQAVEWIQKAAKRGLPTAQRDLAKAILTGYAGLPRNQQNDDFGREMLDKAARAKDPEAMRLLARISLTTELGSRFAPEQALALLNLAVDTGDAASHYDLALLYLEGLIVPRDVERARSLMRKAADLGFSPATAHLLRFELPATLPTTRLGEDG